MARGRGVILQRYREAELLSDVQVFGWRRGVALALGQPVCAPRPRRSSGAASAARPAVRPRAAFPPPTGSSDCSEARRYAGAAESRVDARHR